MEFQSVGFLIFLAAAAVICPVLEGRKRNAGLWCLLALCVGNYLLLGGFRGAVVLAAGLSVTALALRRGRRARIAAAVWHIAVLAAFKYLPFFTGGAVALEWSVPGLSFFTFSQLWLLKEAQPQPLRQLALHGVFFPTVLSGPILKPGAFFPQLESSSFLRPTQQDRAAGLYIMAVGLAKKTLLADNLGVIVANGWVNPGSLTAVEAWLVMLAYTLQLYLDFSGYCDMASGAARLLGLRLPVNFNSPYRALSVGEFWKRWHITLTDFLRQCLYFPLGGSRGGAWKAYRNILIVFVISGLWHGAGWTFILWGALHGLAQIAERIWGAGRQRLPRAIRWGLTFLFVNVAWVFFRAPDVTAALELLRSAVSGGLSVGASLGTAVLESEVTALRTLVPRLADAAPLLAVAVLEIAGLTVALWPVNGLQRWDTLRPTAARAVVCAILAAWSVLSFSGVSSFIYSNF